MKTRFQKVVMVSIIYLTISFPSFSQKKKVTIIDAGIYKSYFSAALRESLYVVYKLYKGGGDCGSTYQFHVTRPGTATDADYAATGKIYDKGHLANAEDFRVNCDDLKKTYEYFNCVPQTEKLNRGIWKSWETKIRKESQNAHLLIICGAIYGNKTIGPNKLAVPDYCWKIVYNAKNKRKAMHTLFFANDDSDSVDTTMTVKNLKSKLKYKLKYTVK